MTEPSPEEDITPVDTLPETQLPEEKPATGWQEPPLSNVPTPDTCKHMGRSFALISINNYAMGARWVCICGQIFVKAETAGGKITLRKLEDVSPAAPYDGVETVDD